MRATRRGAPYDALLMTAFDALPSTCLRCGKPAQLRFAGPCADCVIELYAKFPGGARDVTAAEYEPKMNVTPNAVAVKDD